MIRLFDRSTHRSATTARSASLCVLLAGCVAAIGGCDLSDTGAVSLQIVKPVDGQTFTSKDDVAPKDPGTQIDVAVAAVGVGADTIVELYRLDGGEPVAASIATATIADNQALFSAFRLEPGENQLQARIKDSERTSESITVKFEDSCGSLRFIEPSASADSVRLGPSDDQDDEPCGDTFTTRVVASTGLPDKTQVALLVNGQVRSTAMSDGGIVTFEDVVLGNRGNTPNRLGLQITSSGCGEIELDADVLVACAGPSCSLGGPTASELSSADDKDAASAGLQLDFDVQTDAAGKDVMLLINGDVDNAKTAAPSGGKASFSSVSLPEGKGVRVKAVCTGDNGLTASDERVFTVDSTACAVAVTSPEANEEFLAAQASGDVAPSATLEINVTATVGSDCVSYQVAALDGADCEGIAEVDAEPLTAGQTAIAENLTLETQGDQHVCVQVVDGAGNTAVASIPVSFDKIAPELNFTIPAAALSVNIAGTGGRVADQTPATPTCDRAMTVSCSQNGGTVEILTAADSVVLASAACTGGVASFAAVPLPSENDGSSYDIIARSTGANTLIGTSAPRTITADCQAQTLNFSNITCGTTVIRSSSDADPMAAGIQFDVNVENNPSPRPAVSLTLDGTAASPATSSTTVGQNTVFDNVTFTLDATPVLRACTTDSAGNASCTTDCSVIVGDVPIVTLTAPGAGSLLTRDLSGQGVAYRTGVAPTSSDCDAGVAGLQIAVSATTSAPNGRAARIMLMPDANADSTALSSVNTTVAAGVVAGCINTFDGDNLVVRVEVDDVNPVLFGVATRTVSIDGNAPTNAVALSATPPACRGDAALSFGEVFDAPGAAGAQRRLVGWERMCAYSPITDEATWTAATRAPDAPSAVNPAANPRTYNWSARTRPDATRYCVVRGYDAAGALTPLAPAVEIAAPPLEERVLTLPSCRDSDNNPTTPCIAIADGKTDSDPNGLTAVAVGDVDNDTYQDVLVAGSRFGLQGQAALYLGSGTGLSLTPAATFYSETSTNFGRSLAGIGDFNADGRNDFAISSSSARQVYVVFGRDTWPAAPIALDAGGACTADLCVGGDANFGLSVAAAGDFDGDGIDDIATVQTWSGARSSVVVLGRSSYPSNPNLGTSPGTCRDARAPASTFGLNCGGGSAPAPDAFRFFVEFAPGAVAAMGDYLYVTHSGASANAVVWAVQKRPYASATGIRAVGSTSDFAHVNIVHQNANSAGTLLDRSLSPLGDFDGDGLDDIAAGIADPNGMFFVYPGQLNGRAAYSVSSTQVGYDFTNDLGGLTNAFGDDIATSQHPVFGLIGDIDQDGYGELMTSSKRAGASTSGSIDLFYGAKNVTLARSRSSRNYQFTDAELLNDAQTNDPYWRRAAFVGDVDGDGNNDIAITEENYETDPTSGAPNSGDETHGRVLILGECDAP